MNKQQGWFSTILALVLIIIILGIAYWSTKAFPIINPPNGEGVACTMDAKICPDGSAVGRVPPTCEFAACPVATSTEATIDTSDWQTYKSDLYSYEIKYPPEFKFSRQVISTDVPDIEEINFADLDYSYRMAIIARGGFVADFCLKDPSRENDISEMIDIGGNKFYVYQKNIKGTGERMALVLGGMRSEYHISHNNQCYIFSFTIVPNTSPLPSDTVLNSKFEIFDQILSTFKFTK